MTLDLFLAWLIILNLILKMFFQKPCKSLNFLGINIRIVENNLVFDIHYKPTNSFNYLSYTNCHRTHTKNNILLLLAKRIVSIVTNNRENRSKKLKEHLLDRKHPQRITDDSFTKYFHQMFKLKITIALHLSKPTIVNIISVWKKPIAVSTILKTKNLKLVSKRKKYYDPLGNPQTYVIF